MGWLITLVLLGLLAICPVGIRTVYDAMGARAWLILGPVRLKLYPSNGKKKTKAPKAKKQTTGTTQATKGGSYQDFLPLVQLVVEFLSAFRKKLRIAMLEFHLVMAGDDPCDLAVNYGKAWAAVGNILPQLERVFTIKKRDIQVACDFTASQTTVRVRADITVALYRLLSMVAVYGFRGLREYLKISNQRKGGAAK